VVCKFLCNFLVDKNYIYVKSAEIKVANFFWSTSNQLSGSGATDYSSFLMAQIQHYFSLFLFSTCLFNNAQLVNGKIQEQIPSNRRLKILVFSPSLSYSHARFLGRIADTFVEAGHETVSPRRDLLNKPQLNFIALSIFSNLILTNFCWAKMRLGSSRRFIGLSQPMLTCWT
jgi:hypothetical protein